MGNEKETVASTEEKKEAIMEISTEETGEVKVESTEESSEKETPVIEMSGNAEAIPDTDSISEVIEKQLKNKNITFDTALKLYNVLDGFARSITDCEVRVWSKYLAILNKLKSIINDVEKKRDDMVKAHCKKDEKGEPLTESFELPLRADDPAGKKPEIGQRFVYEEGQEEILKEKLTKYYGETHLCIFFRVSKTEFLKTRFNPKEFVGHELIARHFVEK